MLTKEQVEQWKDFSVRMAKACYADSDLPPLKWILEEIESVFIELGEDACLYSSWDDSEPYPKEHSFHGVDSRGIKNYPPYLCDLLSNLVEDGVYRSVFDWRR